MTRNPNGKAVLFDLDDTLLCTLPHKWRQHKETAKRFYGIELTTEKIREHWGKPSRELVQIYYEDAEDGQLMLEKYRSLDPHFPKTIFPDTIPLLNYLRLANTTLGIVSNAQKSSVHRDLQRLSLDRQYFDFVHTFEDTGVYKPDPTAFSKALGYLAHRDIHEIVYVGDSLLDYSAASGTGISFIAVTTGATSREEFLNAGVARVIDALGELPQHLTQP